MCNSELQALQYTTRIGTGVQNEHIGTQTSIPICTEFVNQERVAALSGVGHDTSSLLTLARTVSYHLVYDVQNLCMNLCCLVNLTLIIKVDVS